MYNISIFSYCQIDATLDRLLAIFIQVSIVILDQYLNIYFILCLLVCNIGLIATDLIIYRK